MVVAAFRPGAPPRAERERIDERTSVFFETLPSQRILVLPIALIGRDVAYDTAAARELAARLRHDSLGIADAASEPMRLAFHPSSNQLAIYWSRFKALSAEVTASPRPEADYVMLIDVLGWVEGARVGAVHVMVVSGRGDMVYATGWNSHQELFKQLQPRSAGDAARMAAIDLTERRARATPRAMRGS